MKLDAGLMGPLDSIAQTAAEMEALGYDGLLSAEIDHDPFFPLLTAGRPESSYRGNAAISAGPRASPGPHLQPTARPGVRLRRFAAADETSPG